MGLGDAVRLDGLNCRGDETLHLRGFGFDDVPALRAEAVLIQPHRQRRFDGHHADGAAGNAGTPQIGCRGIDDVQYRQPGCLSH